MNVNASAESWSYLATGVIVFAARGELGAKAEAALAPRTRAARVRRGAMVVLLWSLQCTKGRKGINNQLKAHDVHVGISFFSTFNASVCLRLPFYCMNVSSVPYI